MYNKGGVLIINIILLLLGFIFLIKGADLFVDSSSFIARKFGIPSVIVGMTIVAMGTSAPELSVSINSALSGLNDMSIANVVGSNIFNLLAALGLSSLFGKLKISNYKDIFIMLGASFLLALLAANGNLSLLDGIIMLTIFTCYILMMIRQSKKNQEVVEQENKPLFKTILLGILGLIGIIIGGDFVVDSASVIALQLGMSENLVGLTIVALGTSLPETVTSIGWFNFWGCDNLKEIIIYNDTQVIEYTSLLGWQINSDAKIYVPDNLYSNYLTTSGWKRYQSQIYMLSER